MACNCIVSYVYFLDEIPQDEENSYISLPLFIVYTIFAVIGIIFAIVCLVLNLWFRKHKYVVLFYIYTACQLILFFSD